MEEEEFTYTAHAQCAVHMEELRDNVTDITDAGNQTLLILNNEHVGKETLHEGNESLLYSIFMKWWKFSQMRIYGGGGFYCSKSLF